MTDQPIDHETPTERPDSGGLAGAVAPEGIAGALAIVVVVVILAARLAFAGGSGPGPTPRPTVALTPAPTIAPGSPIAGAISTLLGIDQNLLLVRGTLTVELKKPAIDIRGEMAGISGQIKSAKAPLEVLSESPLGHAVATDLGAVYSKVNQAIIDTQVNIQDQATWRKGTQAVIDILLGLEVVDIQLAALLTQPSDSLLPTFAPSPTASQSTGPSPTTTLQPTIAPTSPPPSAPPSASASVPPSPSPGPNILLDPGFEAGVGSPWSLVLNDALAGASVGADQTDPHGGTTSARIDIAATTGRQSAISFQQGNLTVQAGADYRVTLWARAAGGRNIRVRITTASGQTLGNGTNQFAIGPAWTPLILDFSSILGTDTAVLAVEVGESGQSVWIDDVGIARIPPGAP